MDHGIELAYLANLAGGEPHILPMGLSRMDGEWWGATSDRARRFTAVRDGQRVEIVLMEETDIRARVRGIIRCSTTPEDRQRLWDAQAHELHHWYADADDPNLVVVRITPDERAH
jgi:general stress protein 26